MIEPISLAPASSSSLYRSRQLVRPYCFDLLTFGSGCLLSSLTRSGFRDIIEGPPADDDVSLG